MRISPRQWLTWGALIWLCGSAVTASAGATQDIQDLGQVAEAARETALAAARAAGYRRVAARARPMDPRLRLAACDQPLKTEINANAPVLGNTNIGVRCTGSVPWAIYVRLEVVAQVDVTVLRTNLPRGTVLSAGDLRQESRPLSSDHGSVIRDPALAVGKALDRDKPAGAALNHHDVSAPRIIERGQTVTLVSGRAGLEVHMQGKASSHAAVGDRLVVINTRTGRRVEGVVTDSGAVRVD
ncbi:flagellar basal body P-ring formation chaperone FlgA [Haliea atlantica]